MIITIAKKELKSLFYSPLAWSLLAVLQAVLAYMFLSQMEIFQSLQGRLSNVPDAPGLTDLVIVPLYSSAAMILLLVSPLLTMRLIAEERRNKTLSLLMTAPISYTDIILGKFFGTMILYLILISLITLMPLSLALGGDPDWGKLTANCLGLLLLSACFAAIGIYMSCLTIYPAVAAIGSFGLLLLLWILDWTAGVSHQSSEILEYFSMLSHFQNLQIGLINSSDIIYYLLFCITFLMLSIRRLQKDRFQS